MTLTARPTRRLLTAVVAAGLTVPALAACGGGSDDGAATGSATGQATASAPSPTTRASAATASCQQVERPKPRTDEPPQPRPKPSRLQGSWSVTMKTSCGSFTIKLDTVKQPKTAASFASLVKSGFYDGLGFHRVVPGFVVQGGDPAGTGGGGPGYSVHERPPSGVSYVRGVVAMAKTEQEAAGTSGSQFFVVSGNATQLTPDYAVVGRVTAGMDTIDRIAGLASPDPQSSEPTRPVVIRRATLARG